MWILGDLCHNLEPANAVVLGRRSKESLVKPRTQDHRLSAHKRDLCW